MSKRKIDQQKKDKILSEINQIYDEAYELGYNHGRQQNANDIDSTQIMITNAFDKLQQLVEFSPNGVEFSHKLFEVVHCKDCKYHTSSDDFMSNKCAIRLGIWPDGDFCNHGARKESDK